MRTPWTLALLIGLLPGLASPPAVAADGGRRRAILVGVNRYNNDDRNLNTLRYAVSDVTALAPLLAQAGYAVELLTDDEGDRSADRRPTLQNIRRRLNTAIGASQPGDTLLIAFTGHGLQFNGDRNSYFCPTDADPRDRSTLLSLQQLLGDLADCKGTKLVMIDACRNDPAVGRGADASNSFQLPDDVAVLFSCAPEERALEFERYAHGVFFYHVLEGLKGRAANGDGEITWLSLADYVKRQVPRDVNRLMGVRARQTPTLRSGELTGETPVLGKRLEAAENSSRLAIVLQPVGGRVASQKNVRPTQPRVEFVIPGGGGDRLGLRAGDILIQVEGFDVPTREKAIVAIQNRRPGEQIEISVDRDGRVEKLRGRCQTLLTDDELFGRVKLLAEKGDPVAQAALGRFFSEGVYSIRDDSEAVAWYRKSAEQNNPQAQFGLGLMCTDGRGVVKDEAQAAVWYRKAAEQDHADAQCNLGVMYADGHGVTVDDVQAVAWYRKAAEQGHADAQNNLGVMYADGRGVAKDEALAVAWYRKAAEQNNPGAQFGLGLMYAAGRGVVKDEAQAVAWYRKAAEQGHAHAQNNLGVMYSDGRGVAKDESQAVDWLRKAAAQGHVDAIYGLGLMYTMGRGVNKDDLQAVSWYRKAADQNSPKAQFALGVMYATGRGVSKDDAQAVLWHHKAAEQGHAKAQYNLALAYGNGLGVAKDVQKAVGWYRAAARTGYQPAIDSLRRLGVQP